MCLSEAAKKRRGDTANDNLNSSDNDVWPDLLLPEQDGNFCVCWLGSYEFIYLPPHV